MAKLKAPVKISELKSIANEKDLQAIVVLTVERNGVVSVVTYGAKTKKSAKLSAIGVKACGLMRFR